MTNQSKGYAFADFYFSAYLPGKGELLESIQRTFLLKTHLVHVFRRDLYELLGVLRHVNVRVRKILLLD